LPTIFSIFTKTFAMNGLRQAFFTGILAVLLALPNIANATHVIGGHLSYRTLELNASERKYRLSLRLFVDCLRGELDMPRVAKVTVYRGLTNPQIIRFNGVSFSTIPIRDSSFIAPTEYPCLAPPTDVCIKTGYFEWDITLPIVNESYFVVYQICCRNSVIQNVVNPLEKGATYFVEITPAVQARGNQCPEFSQMPPSVVCGNERIQINQSAIDRDGDSLVYSFCPPLDQYSLSPQGCGFVPCAPPFANLQFRPPYSARIPFGDDPTPLSINPRTGIISGVAPILGFFAVSICIQEYRAGQLINTTFRDYEFKVVNCVKTVEAAVVADSMVRLGNGRRRYILNVCNPNLTIQNISKLRGNIRTLDWSIRIDNQIITSQDWEPPMLRFPQNGTYTGSLILNKNQNCGDSIDLEIRVSGAIIAPVRQQQAAFCAGDSVRVGNRFYKSPTTVRDTFRSSRGCDSLVIVTQVAQETKVVNTQKVQLCAGQCIWMGKNRYCTEGVFRDSFKTRAGCDSIVISTIQILKDADCDTSECRVFIPNVFSPNNDNTNDFFEIFSPKAQVQNIQIFDRWGGLVFQSIDSTRWNGMLENGQAAAAGVYVYLIRLVCGDRLEFMRAGDVTLIR
jgi:gliding motility-associated-like protein